MLKFCSTCIFSRRPWGTDRAAPVLTYRNLNLADLFRSSTLSFRVTSVCAVLPKTARRDPEPIDKARDVKLYSIGIPESGQLIRPLAFEVLAPLFCSSMI